MVWHLSKLVFYSLPKSNECFDILVMAGVRLGDNGCSKVAYFFKCNMTIDKCVAIFVLKRMKPFGEDASSCSLMTIGNVADVKHH